jgi:hypothetical protein
MRRGGLEVRQMLGWAMVSLPVAVDGIEMRRWSVVEKFSGLER